MSLRRAKSQKHKREPTIALINVVFLMLVFFLIAGSIAPSLDDRLELVDTRNLEGRAPPDVAVVLPDGSLQYRGSPTTAEEIARGDKKPRIVPDRNLPAAQLIALTRALKSFGATEVWIVTERGLE